MNGKLEIKLAAKRFINDYKLYHESKDIYLAHIDDYMYRDRYEFYSKREKVKFTFDLFKRIIEENQISTNLRVGIWWTLADIFIIPDYLSVFEIISDYLEVNHPPEIVILNLKHRDKLLNLGKKQKEINYKNGSIKFYLMEEKIEERIEEKNEKGFNRDIFTYYEPQ